MILGSIIHEYVIDQSDELNNQITNFLYELRKLKPESDVRSNRNGWQKNNIQVMPQMQLLSNLISKEFEKFIIDEMKPLVETKYFLGNMFCNINPPGSHNLPHVHEGDFTGVYYVKTSDNCGNLSIMNPHQCATTARLTTYFDSIKMEEKIMPIAGRGYFFPTHLVHYVEENKSNEDRISISYNIAVQRK